MSVSSWRSYIDRFNRLKVLVIGDVMLDHYIWGGVSRISPEAPVPIVDVGRETEMPGGAGNVAGNLAALGAEVFIIGLIGQDSAAERLVSLFQRNPIRTEFLVSTPDRPTILKTRIIAHHQQVVRVDRERRGDIPTSLRQQIAQHVDATLPDVQAVVISDYGKGVIDAALIKKIVGSAKRRGIPITVDPKLENFKHYQDVTCITPNLKEAIEGGGSPVLRSDDDLVKLGEQILQRLRLESLLITRGERGMSLFEKRKPPFHIPTRAREVFDVTGAGDTVISTLTLALAAGAPMRIAAEMSNYAAGIVVGKLGTSSVTPQELWRTIKQQASNHG